MFSFKEGPEPEWNLCSTIIPGILYLSDYLVANNAPFLAELAIAHIVQIGDDDDIAQYKEHEGIEYHRINIKDSVKCHFTPPMLDEANRFIQSATTPVLVHCRAGVSRSATVVIGYLMAVRKMTYRKAKNLVLTERPFISPNSTFTKDLLSYEQRLLPIDEQQQKAAGN